MSGNYAEYEGLGFAVASSTADRWFAARASLSPPSPPSCQDPLGPQIPGEVPRPGRTDWAERVATAFSDYFGGINTGNYELAWRRLSPRLRGGLVLDEFAASVRTSYDYNFVANDAFFADAQAHVWLEFVNLQDPSLGPVPGQSCTQWSLDYVLVEQSDGRFLIDKASGHVGSGGHETCL